MIGIGPMELLIVACVGLPMFLGTMVVLLAAIRYLSRPAQPRLEPLATSPVAPALSHQDVLRTRYFQVAGTAPHTCPRCHAALAADAPEGLCPACLLAGGLERNSLPPTSSGHGTPSGAGAVDAAELAAAFPNLEILELLGQGGMGTVFKVRQKNLDRLAALKVIPPQAALDPTFAERFSREARALARLNHANIVTVYDQGQCGGFYFLLMEYINGPNLRQLMRSERIAPREALAIVPQICDALQYAHDQGIVHRDIKPENVLLDRTGRVKIADFGLAKLLGTASADFTLTHTQQVMGTPRYMAPEQIEHPLEVDHRADIYSLGVVIYEMLTGELPIGRFAPPSQKVQVDVRLDEIVLRTLEKEPARRYQQVNQVKTELASVATPSDPRPAEVNSPAEARTMTSSQRSAVEQTVAVAKPVASPPLGIVLAVAIGMVLGMLMMGVGVAMTVAPFFVPWKLDVWPFFGAGVGTLIGGAGAFFGSYNSYRQLAGAADLMSCPEFTWFDYVLLGYGALGIVILIPGIQGLLTNPSEEHVYPMLLIGSIVTFQGMMGMLWRWGARQRAMVAGGEALYSPAQQAWSSVQPGFVVAVLFPTLVVAGVWALVLLDMHLMTSHWPRKADHVMVSVPGDERKIMSLPGDQRTSAILALWSAATGSVAVVFVGLALWRAVGPRRTVAGAKSLLAIAPPFGHPVWPIAVAVISFATFVFPWVRLHLDPVVREPDFKVQLTPGTDYDGDTLRRIAGMPQGERYVATGAHNVGGAAAAILFAVGGPLAVGMMLGRGGMMRVQAGIAIAAGVLAVLIIVAYAHQLGERDESLIIDAITLRGLSRTISGIDVGPGSGPALVLQEYVNVSPALGLYLAAGMAGLLILISATQWVWSAGIPDIVDPASSFKPQANPLPVKVLVGDERESVRKQVRGPGMGLIVSGVAGLLPIVLLCVAIPASWVVLVPVQTQPTRAIYQPGAAVMTTPVVASIGIWQPPVVLGQVAAPPPQGGATPTIVGLLGILILGVVFVVALPASILLILGGMKMRQLHNYGLAYLAAIVALLPLGPQWLISLPMGIWALAVLGRPEVKAAFE